MTMRCPRCAGEAITNIAIDADAKDEKSLMFYSCRRCEEKWWERDGAMIELREVLDLTSK